MPEIFTIFAFFSGSIGIQPRAAVTQGADGALYVTTDNGDKPAFL